MHKKIFLGVAFISLLSSLVCPAATPCDSGELGVLNAGIVPGVGGTGSLPQNGWDSATNSAIGFDPFLLVKAAQLLGYDRINFIGYANDTDAETALAAGEIQVIAHSTSDLETSAPYDFIGVVTDISQLWQPGAPLGWRLDTGCCGLALSLEAAVNELVENGGYAQVLQTLRFEGLTNGQVLGIPRIGTGITGVLYQPFEFASSELGTIPASCGPTGSARRAALPTTNCISQYLQDSCSPTITFTGVTGSIE